MRSNGLKFVRTKNEPGILAPVALVVVEIVVYTLRIITCTISTLHELDHFTWI